MATSPHVWTEMMGLTMEIVARTLLGAAVENFETIEQAITVVGEYTYERLQRLIDLPEWLPLPGSRRFRGARHTLDKVVYELIDGRRRSGAQAGPLPRSRCIRCSPCARRTG